MDRDELTRRLMTVFLEEMEEHVSAWSRDLLAFEKTGSESERDALVRSLFRTAHSLKGAARSVGLDALEQLCHALESQLAAVRDGREALDAASIEDLLREGDRLEQIRAALGRGERIDALVAGPAPARREEQLPPEPPLGTTTAGLRVSGEKLDALLVHAGEVRAAAAKLEARLELLHVAGARLADERRRHMEGGGAAAIRGIEQELRRLGTLLRAEIRAVAHAAAEYERDVRATRMMPFEQACDMLERVVRDAAKASGKVARLEVIGGEVEIDRAVLESLRDPLVQLVRNAVVHGIEPAAARRASGKPEEGRIVVAARVMATEVEVEVSDDGAGLDRERIGHRAVERGLPAPRDVHELARLVFLPGFSTASRVDEHSGRGVGLDVVKARVEAIHGAIEVETSEGAGTAVVITAPLTLSTVQAVVVRAHSQLFAIPTTLVRTMRRVDPRAMRLIEGRAAVVIEDEAYAFASLQETLGLPPPEPPVAGTLVPIVVVVGAAGAVAMRVDELVAVEPLVVEPLGPRIRNVRNIAGAASPAGGGLALVLSGGELVQSALASRSPVGERGVLAVAPPRRTGKLLVVDDSATTRALERTILEGAGFEVVLAEDGEEAWRLLQQRQVDVVVSDVEMPNVSGLELTRRIRASGRHRNLPVVLLTALARDEDRLAGMEAGANAYLVKNAFDQSELLRTIEQLL